MLKGINPLQGQTRSRGRRRPRPVPARVDERRGQAGVALLIALMIMMTLSMWALALALLTESQLRLGKTVETRTQAYYAALAGLEEARGRLNGSAPDAISSAMLPKNVKDVFYLVNSSTQDPVDPTNPTSPYFDSEYATEFTGGFSSATILGKVPSDQPGAGTAFAIPYKWVRVTLKTEYSSQQDVDHNGTLDSTTPIFWNGSNQDLSTRMVGGSPVYMLTALAVEPSGIRKLAQAEMGGSASTAPATPVASVSTTANVDLTGLGGGAGGGGFRFLRRLRQRLARRLSNLAVSGMDACGTQNITGVSAGGNVTTTGLVTLNGSPSPSLQLVAPTPPSAGSLMQALQGVAVPILTADTTHVTPSGGGTSYTGTDVVLGQPAGGGQPPRPVIVYSDKPLTVSGSTASGVGILLVKGDLSISGGFTYSGIIVATGNVTLANDSRGSISIQGAVVTGGNMSANSTASPMTSLKIDYNSCAVAQAFQAAPQNVTLLAAKELSF